MNVSLKCFGQLANSGACDYRAAAPHDLPAGTRAADLIDRLGFRDEEVKLVYVNNLIVPPQTTLQDGDRVALAPPSGGM